MKKNILIIEDEDTNYIASINLLKEKYNVRIARSLEAADNFFKLGHDVDLIILDVMMSYHGYSAEETNYGMKTGLAYYNRKLREKTDVKVLVWTNNKDAIEKKEEWGENVVGLQLKMSEVEHLVNLVDKVFNEKK